MELNPDRKYILSAEEREFCFNISCADEEASIDVAKCSTFNKYIKILDELVEEGKARVFIEDDYHKYYKVDKNAIRFIVPKHTRILSEEEKTAVAARLKKAREENN